jgi:antitoxin component HigA of HigAB toxin-antitoxin module
LSLFLPQYTTLGLYYPEFLVPLPNELGKGIFLIYNMVEKHIKIGSEIIQNKSEERWKNNSLAIATVMSSRMVELGLTQRTLAKKMNCTQQYVSKVLKGRENLSLETMCKIEDALDIKVLNTELKK